MNTCVPKQEMSQLMGYCEPLSVDWQVSGIVNLSNSQTVYAESVESPDVSLLCLDAKVLADVKNINRIFFCKSLSP